MGVAYVVARRNGRFEIRESLHTRSGPRARSLSSFTVLTDEVLERARRRAARPFDADAVIASGRRAGALADLSSGAPRASGGGSRRFVDASRRMALSLAPSATQRRAADPGRELIELLRFAEVVSRSQPPRRRERLRFPVMCRLVEERRAAAGAH